MTSPSRVESQLSDHSSLNDEIIDLDRERRRKQSKSGQHPATNNLTFAGAAYATDVAAKRRQASKKSSDYNVANALKIAGGVAIAGAAWLPERYERKIEDDKIYSTAIAATVIAKAKRFNKRNKSKSVAEVLKVAGGVAVAGASWTASKSMGAQNSQEPLVEQPQLTLAGAVAAATAINKAKSVRKRQKYSVAEALRKSGGVAIAASSWVPNKHTMKGVGRAAQAMAKANVTYKRAKEYNVAEALRVVGGVAIAACAWTRKPPEDVPAVTSSSARTVGSINLMSTGVSPARDVTPVELPILVDMATSPIPLYETTSAPGQTPSNITLIAAHSSTPVQAEVASTQTPAPSVPTAHTSSPSILPDSPETSVISVQPITELTPKIITPPADTATPTLIAPSTQAGQPVVHTIIRDETRHDSPHSRKSNRRSGAALLVAAAAIDSRKGAEVTPVLVATPPVNTTPPDASLTVLGPVEEVTPEVQIKTPTPKPQLEQVPIQSETAQTVAEAGASKPKPTRRALAQLTPLEKLAAKSRSLQ